MQACMHACWPCTPLVIVYTIFPAAMHFFLLFFLFFFLFSSLLCCLLLRLLACMTCICMRIPTYLSLNSLLTATATIRKKSSSPAGLSIVSCFLFVYSIELLLLVSRCWCCCWYTVPGIVCVVLAFYAGSGFCFDHYHHHFTEFIHICTHILPPTHPRPPLTHTFGHCIANSIEHPFADNPPNTSLSLPFSNRSRYSYIVLWKCIAALKCNRWSPSNSRLFVLFLFVLAVVLLFMLPPLALAGRVHSLFSAALELFIEMLAPFWLESWKLFFFSALLRWVFVLLELSGRSIVCTACDWVLNRLPLVFFCVHLAKVWVELHGTLFSNILLLCICFCCCWCCCCCFPPPPKFLFKLIAFPTSFFFVYYFILSSN